MKNLNRAIVMDFDDILVFLSQAFYRTIRNNWQKYSLYFKNLGLLTKKEIYNRPSFYFTDWLLQDDFYKLEKEKQEKIIEGLVREFDKDFFSINFYKYLEPTPFAKKTLQNKLYIENPAVKKIYILSRNCSPKMEEYKKEFVKKHFNNSKIEMIFVGTNEKKSDALNKLNIDWGLLIDDEIKNIRDIAENCDLEEREFLIPSYGYNKMPLDLSLLIHGKKGIFNYYDPFEEEEK